MPIPRLIPKLSYAHTRARARAQPHTLRPRCSTHSTRHTTRPPSPSAPPRSPRARTSRPRPSASRALPESEPCRGQGLTGTRAQGQKVKRSKGQKSTKCARAHGHKGTRAHVPCGNKLTKTTLATRRVPTTYSAYLPADPSPSRAARAAPCRGG